MKKSIFLEKKAGPHKPAFLMSYRWVFLISIVFLVACEKKKTTVDYSKMSPQQLVEQGKKYYSSSCTSCHAADPRKDHSLGPAVWGADLALLEARILRGAYPDGYSPKRTTRLMAAMPFLKEQIPAIHAYLNAP